MTTRAMQRSSSNSTSATEARTVVVRSVSIAISIEDGTVARSFGSSALMRSTTSNDVGARLPLDVHNHGRRVVHPRRLHGVLDAIDDIRDILQHDRAPFLYATITCW